MDPLDPLDPLDPDADALADDAIPLCPACLSETDPRWDFCQTCMAPLTFYAATGPYESIWAGAWILARSFQTAWPRALHAWGPTLAFGPDLAALAFIVVFGGAQFWPSPGELPQVYDDGWGGPEVGSQFVWLLGALAMTTLYLAFIVRAWRNVRARGHRDPWPEEPAA